MEVTEWLVWKVHNLISDTLYVMSLRARTSVGLGPAISVSAATQPLSREYSKVQTQIENNEHLLKICLYG